MKYKVLLSLGSNKGNRKENLEKAIIQIQNLLGDVIAISPIYESPSWGYKDEAYLNNAICLVTDVEPIELMDALLNIENSLGRLRTTNSSYEAREIDLDIILIAGLIIEHPKLEVPHPRMSLRRFVLKPLTDIAPNWEHEKEQIPLSDLLLKCEDPSELKLYGSIS
jgi:deoxyguanosine kinase